MEAGVVGTDMKYLAGQMRSNHIRQSQDTGMISGYKRADLEVTGFIV